MLWIRAWLVKILAVVYLMGCATGPDREQQGPVFYPPLPNSPRLQHLHSITTLKDIGGGDAFANFVLGKEANQAVVQKPYGLAVQKNRIYVVDSRSAGYVILDLVEKKQTLVTGSGSGRLKKPINISIDNEGYKYITDTGRNQVLQFDAQDQFVKAYGVEGQFKPGDAVVAGNKLFISDLKHHYIHVLDKNSGATMYKIAEKPGETEQDKKLKAQDGQEKKADKSEVYFPTNMLVTDKHLYVSDTGYFKVVKYTLDGKFVTSYGEVGTGLGKFARPKGVALDKEENLYVVDAAFENVQIFDPTGKLLLYFGGPGAAPENINLPSNIVVDYENIEHFQQYVAPGFKLEYVVLVASQFGVNRVNVFGYGRMEGMQY